MKAIQARVTGQVQGVAFRWHTQERAQQLGVVGWVRNEVDGSVHGHAEGDDDAVEAWVAWCHEGSPAASVERVVVTAATLEGLSGFETRA